MLTVCLMTIYSNKPNSFLQRLHFSSDGEPIETLCCAGFELSAWRCKPFAKHLLEWLPDYALTEEELQLHHGSAYDKLCEAAVRVYTSKKYEKRGEAGEIALHAICREYFGTIPISPRVFYQSSSNDVIKAFDMVHARIEKKTEKVELWLGESKLYQNRARAITDAIKSIKDHIDAGFLTNQKLLLGPQIPKSTPQYEKIRAIFQSQTSLDELLSSAVFAVGILTDSGAAKNAMVIDQAYTLAVKTELDELTTALKAASFPYPIRIAIIYVPLGDKKQLVQSFDRRLKGLTDA